MRDLLRYQGDGDGLDAEHENLMWALAFILTALLRRVGGWTDALATPLGAFPWRWRGDPDAGAQTPSRHGQRWTSRVSASVLWKKS